MGKERWRRVPGFPDYDVSDRGRIRSWKSGSPKLMKIKDGADGYPRITLLRKNGMKEVVRVHIAVARAFIGKGGIVRHGVNGKSDPSLSNLTLGSSMDNHRDKYRDGTHQMGGNNSNAVLTELEVRKIRKEYDRGHLSQADLAAIYGISRQAVSDILRGKTWTSS